MSKPKEVKAMPKKAIKPTTMKILTGSDSIKAAIASLEKRGKSFTKDLHIAAVSTLVHADKHGDITLANRLIDALPASQRKNALRDWFLAFGAFQYDAQNKVMAHKKGVVTQTQKAIETPFWEFTKEAAYVPYDAMSELTKFMNRMFKAVDNKEAVPELMIDKLMELKEALNKAKTTIDVLAA